MKKFTKIILFVLIGIIGALGIWKSMSLAFTNIDNVVALDVYENGDTLLIHNQNEDLVFSKVNKNGIQTDVVSIPLFQGDYFISVADVKTDELNNVYFIQDYLDKYTGEYVKQDLFVYNLDSSLFYKKATIPLENEDFIRYKWLTVDNSVVLMGMTPSNDQLARVAMDLDDLRDKEEITIKKKRVYPVNPSDGIFQAIPFSSEVVYSTMSGKIFVTSEEATEATEVYPARVLDTLMYPMFISENTTETILMGEQESGDIVALNIANGTTETFKNGMQSFSGTSQYTPKDIMKASFIDDLNFTGVVKNPTLDKFELVVSQQGEYTIVETVRASLGSIVLNALKYFGIYLMFALVLFGCVKFFFWLMKSGRTIFLKLAFTTIPMLVIALTFFGMYAYSSYNESINDSYQKQVIDEGNMLTALFGTESFNEIEYPYDYTGEAYGYLQNQMSSREMYTRNAYYENGEFYVGVCEDLPCFYPLEVTMNMDAIELYEKAALTGTRQSGIINDRNGKRISSVTPMGGATGDTVYLLETGIQISQMLKYTQAYVQNYIIVAMIFIFIIIVLVVLVLRKILAPLKEIKDGLEVFAQGDRRVRLVAQTNDELSDITRVFNNMANDINVQIFNLKELGNTYYRFIPQKIFKLLNKDNLGDLQLGSSISGIYPVLLVDLNQSGSKNTSKEDINEFFNIINTVVNEYDATLVTDSSNLRHLKIISNDADISVAIAMSAIAQIDAHNALHNINERIEVSFLVHKADIYYGICGDEQRFVPALISDELDWLSRNCEQVRHLSSRLIVTSVANSSIDTDKYDHRFIGNIESDKNGEIGLHDYYGSSSAVVIRLVNNTKTMFDKAMQLYLEGRFYDAKNIFAVVLRENQYDNVARHYIFKCEKKI